MQQAIALLRLFRRLSYRLRFMLKTVLSSVTHNLHQLNERAKRSLFIGSPNFGVDIMLIQNLKTLQPIQCPHSRGSDRLAESLG
jgi:hypothetical protein